MRCSISTKDLKSSISKLGLSPNQNVSIQSFNNRRVLISQIDEENRLWHGGYMPAKDITPGVVYLPGTFIQLIANTGTTKQITINSPQENGLIQIAGAGRSKVKLRHQAPWKQPVIPETWVDSDIAPRELGRALNAANAVAQPKSNDPRTQSVILEKTGGRLDVIATDAISLYHTSVKGSTGFTEAILLNNPGKAAQILSNTSSSALLRVAINPNAAWFNVDSLLVAVPRGAQDPLKWRALLQVKTPWKIQIKSEDLRGLLRRCRLMAEPPTNGIQIQLGENNIHATSKHSSHGTMSDEINHEWIGTAQPGTIILAPGQQFTRAVGLLNHDNPICIGGSEMGKPLILWEKTGGETQIVIMQLSPDSVSA